MLMDKLSIIIPCRNEEKYIEDCIISLLSMKNNLLLKEIIVVDGKSDDNTVKIVNKLRTQFENIKLVINDKKITPVALNLGIKSAEGNYIMIASAHSKFSENYISVLMENLKELDCDCVGGVLKTDVKVKNKKSLSICRVLSNKFGVGNSMFRIGTQLPVMVDIVPFGLYKKNIFYEVGFYNEKLKRNQDMEFAKRLLQNGKKIYLIPSAECVYFAREEYIPLAKNNFGNGEWILLTTYLTKKTSSLSLRHFIPLLFIISIIVPCVLMPLSRYFGLITLTVLISYISLISIVSKHIKDKSTTFIYIFWTFIVVHFSYGLGSLVGIFKINHLFKK